jgi:Meckel syndrome type 1 protein
MVMGLAVALSAVGLGGWFVLTRDNTTTAISQSGAAENDKKQEPLDTASPTQPTDEGLGDNEEIISSNPQEPEKQAASPTPEVATPQASQPSAEKASTAVARADAPVSTQPAQRASTGTNASAPRNSGESVNKPVQRTTPAIEQPIRRTAQPEQQAAAPAPTVPPPEAAPTPPAANPQGGKTPLDLLRAELKVCDGKNNLLSRGACIIKARHKHCGDMWGKTPECPLSNSSNTN